MQDTQNDKDIVFQQPQSELQNGSLPKDLFFLILKIIVVLILIQLVYSPDLLLSFLSIILVAILVSTIIRDAYTIFHYYNAKQYVEGRYLNKVSPVCPFLLVTSSGFKCQAEFKLPFSMENDFPRCHDDAAFKSHWKDKAPGILEQAKNESSMLKLRSHVSALARIEYKGSTDFFLDIILCCS